ncbi:hypothetical protein [Staphylococcus simiae]|uniref:Lipoprotein n=1 Tax=Staphylococcus simiae CCM 7213 = CCUG 51256 TaxID=911238 RepID=G5JG92_9STAP|nr:hypothetical protein [Staphylococcus simiae]EHJ08805.1 hypothetical protein SS7213T_02318 [Staphylococcus simiae CCM 7213 = CCUG 51256]PNZ13010.1 hypothetical protein CD113_05865 [Staphylococcus simiae]SNV64089.1 Uncharacterised protein [Staphylococcus simiae]
MKIRHLLVAGVSASIILTGCNDKESQTANKHEEHKDNSENKTSNIHKNDKENNDINDNSAMNNNQNSNQNNHVETQAEANQRLQEESRSEHNGLTNSEYAIQSMKNTNNKEYQDYLNAKQAQYNLTHMSPEQKAKGAGGGGAGWNYADENESFEQWKARTDVQKANAGYTE